MKEHLKDGTYYYPLQNYKNFNRIHMFANFMQHDDSNSDLIRSILQSLFLFFEPLIGIHELLLGSLEVALKF